MTTTIFFWVAIGVALVITAILATVLLSGGDSHKSQPVASADVNINTAEGSIVTVRKVGSTTSVIIRTDIHDHWEGSDGIEISPAPIELTRREEPELYEEYMSPKTPASRKYEIADYIYSIGLTLPFIHGLHEQWQKEQQMNPATERTPVNPKGGTAKDGIVYRKLDINHNLRNEPMSDIDSGPDAPEGQKEKANENEDTDH